MMEAKQPINKGPLTTTMMTLASVALGSRFGESLKEMGRVQWLSTHELLARSEARLATLLRHAAENVPYYRDFYKRLRVSSPMNYGRIAICGPCRSSQSQIIGRVSLSRFPPTNVPASLRIERKTSGSTGEPFQFALDRRALPMIFASHLFYDSWHGLNPFDRYLRITAPPAAQGPLPSDASTGVRLKRAITNRLQNLYESWTQEKISLWEVNSKGAESIWRRMETFQTQVRHGLHLDACSDC